MSKWFSLPIGRVLRGLFGLLMMIVGSLAFTISGDFQQLAQSGTKYAGARPVVFGALQKHPHGRGPTRVALDAKDPPDSVLLSTSAQLRAKADPVIRSAGDRAAADEVLRVSCELSGIAVSLGRAVDGFAARVRAACPRRSRAIRRLPSRGPSSGAGTGARWSP
jgi:hypothetical protein